jgi:aminoethylphosphonate catabolism LysR family transcriptional regulator
MTPAQARAFVAVAVEGSFTAAARRLNVSQPTVTSQVGLIEKRYKVELFHRTGRGVRLTSAGAALLPILRRMFASLEEAVAYLDDLRGLRQGHLRVGSYGPYDVTALVARYRKRFPALSVSVDFANSRILAENLLKYDLDVAVLDRIDDHPEFQVLPFRTPVLVVIAPRTAAWAGRRSIAVEELKRHVLVCREPGSATRAAFDRLVGAGDVPPHRLLQFGSREGVVSAVAEGAGIGAIFDDGALPENRIIKLSIKGPVISSKVDVVCLAERRTSQLISDFLTIASEYLRECRPVRAARHE